jgi:hypothetical protein
MMTGAGSCAHATLIVAIALRVVISCLLSGGRGCGPATVTTDCDGCGAVLDGRTWSLALRRVSHAAEGRKDAIDSGLDSIALVA